MIVAELERNAAFISAILPNRVYPPLFNRYAEGMGFGTHVDGTVRGVAGSPHKLRTDLSATLFLSAPQSYDGGELVIESDFGNQSAKLEAGELVVYSSTSRHRVAPVTRDAIRIGSHHSDADRAGRGSGGVGSLDGALSWAAEDVDGDLVQASRTYVRAPWLLSPPA